MMAVLFFTFFSGVTAATCMWSIDTPIVSLTNGIVSFLFYCIAWRLHGEQS